MWKVWNKFHCKVLEGLEIEHPKVEIGAFSLNDLGQNDQGKEAREQGLRIKAQEGPHNQAVSRGVLKPKRKVADQTDPENSFSLPNKSLKDLGKSIL